MADGNKSKADSNGSDRFSRRRVLELSTVASIGGLAGCSGGDGTDSSDTGGNRTDSSDSGSNGGTETGDSSGSATERRNRTSGQGQGDPVTTEIKSRFGAWEPSNANFNFFSPTGNQPPFSTYLWTEGTLYRNSNGQITYHTIDDVEFNDDGKEVVFHFNEGYSWWDGTDLTADDYLVQRRIDQFQQFGSLDEADVTLEKVDDYTVREVRNSPVNPSFRLLSHVQAMYTKADYYRQWLDQYRNAGNQEEVDSITQDLTQHQISMEKFVDEGLGCSLWKPEKWNPQRVTYTKHEDHPRADWTNLDTWVWELVGGDQKFDQAFKNGQFDMGEISFDLVSESDTYEPIWRMGLPGVPKLTINFDNKHLGRRGVRRAIAYLVDHDQLRQVLQANHGTPYKTHPNINGMSSKIAKNWLGTDHLDQLLSYGSSAQPEKARQAMRNAGYSKNGEFWVGPDGDKVNELTYISPPWQIYQSIQQYLGPLLTDFGLGIETVQPSSANFYKRLNESYEFDLLNWYHFGFHPANNYYVGEGTPTGLDAMQPAVEGTVTADEPPKLNAERTQRLNQPIRPQFPTEVGSKELSGEGQTLYPLQWNQQMGQSQDKKAVADIARKLSWYYNWQVPHIGFYEEVWQSWGRTDEFTYKQNHPETDRTAREHTIPNEDAIQVWQGHVSAKTE